MGRMVVLHHLLPDGSAHFDWLIHRPSPESSRPMRNPAGVPAEPPGPLDPDARILLSLQTQSRPDDPRSGVFAARQLPDHRAIYLTFEGPLSGDRGQVRRVAQGVVHRLEHEPEDRLLIVGQFEGCTPAAWRGIRLSRHWWFHPVAPA
jgi:hypothetical protein